eukprot:GFYU01009175.1.p1 GENE.GFYU01009175.1~~GFYU01009175.1.p1  ORF type:complete len:672 (+),score=249.33 GFYU01009175.1:314-2329(+)
MRTATAVACLVLAILLVIVDASVFERRRVHKRQVNRHGLLPGEETAAEAAEEDEAIGFGTSGRIQLRSRADIVDDAKDAADDEDLGQGDVPYSHSRRHHKKESAPDGMTAGDGESNWGGAGSAGGQENSDRDNVDDEDQGKEALTEDDPFDRDAKPDDVEGATAALLSWKRTQNLPKILGNIAKRSWIKEVIIWNNNNETKLKASDYRKYMAEGVDLVVLNRKENVNNIGRFEACVRAKYRSCYMQDDDWVPTVLDSLWESYKTEPNLVHAMVGQTVYMWNALWSYFNQQLGMHSSFAYIGVGSIVPRWVALNFLKQVRATPQGVKFGFCADVMFTIWTNEMPVLLESSSTVQNEIKDKNEKTAYSKDTKFTKCRLPAQIEATEVMAAHLKNNSGLFSTEFFSKDYKKRSHRALTLEDDAIFITDIADYKIWDENFTQDQAKNRIAEIYGEYNEDTGGKQRNPPEVEWQMSHDYLHAVDEDVFSAWTSKGSTVKAGTYYGLYMLQALGKRNVTVYVGHNQEALKMELSTDGEKWTAAPHKFAVNPNPYNETRKVYQYYSDKKHKERWVRFVSPYDSPDGFQVFEISCARNIHWDPEKAEKWWKDGGAAGAGSGSGTGSPAPAKKGKKGKKGKKKKGGGGGSGTGTGSVGANTPKGVGPTPDGKGGASFVNV